jgi:hypothetical protein
VIRLKEKTKRRPTKIYMHDVIRQISDFSSKVKEANNALPSKSKQHRWNSLQTEASIFFSKSNFGGCGLYMMMCQANHATRAELYARGNSLHRHVCSTGLKNQRDANSDPPILVFCPSADHYFFFF